MDPLSLIFSNPKNILIAILVAVATVASGTAYYFFHQNITLHEQNAVQKREAEIYVATHNQQITLLTDTITKQNASIDAFKKTSDKQTQEMGKVQSKVEQMRVTAEQQLAEMRNRNMVNLTCDESIDFLIQQSKELKWGVQK